MKNVMITEMFSKARNFQRSNTVFHINLYDFMCNQRSNDYSLVAAAAVVGCTVETRTLPGVLKGPLMKHRTLAND